MKMDYEYQLESDKKFVRCIQAGQSLATNILKHLMDQLEERIL